MLQKLSKVLLFALLLSGVTTAQQSRIRPGIGIFGASYSGDLNRKNEALYRFNPGVNLSLQFISQSLITPQFNLGVGSFTAQNRELEVVEGIQPNTFAKTSFFFLDFRLKAKFLRQTSIHPFGSLGLGLLSYTPHDQDGNALIDNTSSRKEGEIYGTIAAGFPLSLGLEIEMSPFLTLFIEGTHRLTTTDYLDNIGELGTKDGNDKLRTLQLGLIFTLQPERPKIYSPRGREYNQIKL